MGLSYYGFAFFVFVLLCVLALLCKRLFLRGKGQIQNMDEKEKKLLALYSTMEDMMDEFNQTAQAAREEMNRHIEQMRNVKADARQAAPISAAKTTYAPPPPTQPNTPAAPAQETRNVNKPPAKAQENTPPFPQGATERLVDRPAQILSLHKQGMDRLHIAKQLSVTLSEVDLVLGIAGQKK